MTRRLRTVMRSLCALLVTTCGSAFAQHAAHDMPGMGPSPGSTAAPVMRSRADPDTPRPPEDTSGPTSMPVSDDMIFYQVLLNQIEYTHSSQGSGMAWDVQGWVGRDYNRLWLKSEGARQGGHTEDGRLELLWSKPVAAFWDLQAGVRHDFGGGPTRNWLAFGVEGIAPYMFDVEATAYAGSSGAAVRLDGKYELALTQRTWLTPRAEANLYSRADPERGLGAGLSDVSFGLRLRHEFRRELAPYVGVEWNHRFGGTADQARAAGEPVTDRKWVAGVRIWF
jgi:copper resistance protein B